LALAALALLGFNEQSSVILLTKPPSLSYYIMHYTEEEWSKNVRSLKIWAGKLYVGAKYLCTLPN
jgi:hypothetical protein